MQKERTKGEKIIEFFLEDEGLKYEAEVEIHTLESGIKKYRRADFYLPKYKVYLEFLGQWNTKNGKERYNKKKTIYKQNNIPCIYIYPDNLGAIKYLFYMRLAEILKNDPELKPELRKYKLTICRKTISWLWLGFLITVMFMTIFSNLSQLNYTISPYITLLIFAGFLASIFLSICIIKRVFHKK